MATVILALASAAQVDVDPGDGPTKVRPRPEPPFGPTQPPAAMREYAEVIRARAREAQKLADSLCREADGLDRLAREQFGPGMGPQEMDSRQREMTVMREQEVRRMAENLGAMKQKIAILRQQSVQAKQDGRYEEAKGLWEKAQQLEQDAQKGLEKIERFKAGAQIKDLQMMAGRAKKQGDDQKAQALLDEARGRKERVKIAPKGTPQDSDLLRMVEELRGEVKQLRRELDELRAQSGGAKPK